MAMVMVHDVPNPRANGEMTPSTKTTRAVKRILGVLDDHNGSEVRDDAMEKRGLEIALAKITTNNN